MTKEETLRIKPRPRKPGHHTKPLPESFDSWCRRARVLPGDPTPAMSSPRPGVRRYSTEAFSTTLKGGPDTMPPLKTTLEIFCLRTGRVFRARETSIKREFYQRPGWLTQHSRELVACKHCPDTHVLISEWQATSFGLLGDPIGGARVTRRDRAFGRRMNDDLFDRRKFPPVENVEAA